MYFIKLMIPDVLLALQRNYTQAVLLIKIRGSAIFYAYIQNKMLKQSNSLLLTKRTLYSLFFARYSALVFIHPQADLMHYLLVYLGAWKLPPAQRNRSRQLTVGWKETGVSLPFWCQWTLRSVWPILITHTKKTRVSFSASPWLLYFNLCPLSLLLALGTTENLHLPIRYLYTLIGSSLLITRSVLPASSCTLFLPTQSISVSFHSSILILRSLTPKSHYFILVWKKL